jgi:hypothetical protein
MEIETLGRLRLGLQKDLDSEILVGTPQLRFHSGEVAASARHRSRR